MGMGRGGDGQGGMGMSNICCEYALPCVIVARYAVQLVIQPVNSLQVVDIYTTLLY